MARLNFGQGINDYKGYLGEPPVNGTWSAYCLPLNEQLERLKFIKSSSANLEGPIFRRGVLRIDGEPHDTWLDSKGFTKGYVWVNGFNLGRYWETTVPQHTLYVPASVLRAGNNEVVVLDLHHS